MEDNDDSDDLDEFVPAYTQNERPPCPFYGFASVARGRLKDIRGNSCALVEKGTSPCRMESQLRERPDFDSCPYNVPKIRANLKKERMSRIKISPIEFEPVDQDTWSGISFREWLDFLNKIHGRDF